MSERERQALLRAKVQELVDDLPAWDGVSPAVLVTFTDPVTRDRLAHWFTPAGAAPQSQPAPKPKSSAARPRHLHAVREAS